MSEIVVIRLSSESPAVEWIRVDTSGTRLSPVSTGTLEDAARMIETREVLVLVPATDVLTTGVAIPVRSPAKIRAALPFALEENLAEDLDSLHFAAGKRRDDGVVPVTVVAHDKMQHWLLRLADAGIIAARLIAENHGLAVIPGSMSVLVDDHCVMFNDGDNVAFAMQDVRPSDLLAAAGCLGAATEKDENVNKKHLLAFCNSQHNEALTHDWNALRHELSSVDISVLPDGALPKLAVTVASGHGVNLLQGQYGQQTDYEEILRPWKTAAALLLGLMLIGLAGKGSEVYRLSNEHAALQEQFTAQYRQLRPGDRREIADPINAVRSIQRGFSSSASPQLFLPGIKAFGNALASNDDSVVEVITYRAGVIDIRLTAPDVPTLDRIRSAVGESGRFEATIQSTDQVADKINGRLRIRESGS